ncbi:MAG: Mpo1-like protein [Gammaproteobacteria bacterium]
MNEKKIYHTLNEFYLFYLTEHTNRISRLLHFTGTSLALVLLFMAFIFSKWWLALFAFIQGYAFAWTGHFFFERNKPATFKYPWFSFLSDWRMWWEMLTGKIRF